MTSVYFTDQSVNKNISHYFEIGVPMSIQCQPVIGIDDRKPNMGFHMDHMTSMYFTDRSVNYNFKFNMLVSII